MIARRVARTRLRACPVVAMKQHDGCCARATCAALTKEARAQGTYKTRKGYGMSTGRTVMRSKRWLTVLRAGLALSTLAMTTVEVAQAQTPMPTDAQLEIYKNMSPEQQQQILQQVTGGSGGGGGGGGGGLGGLLGGSGSQSQRNGTNQDTDRQPFLTEQDRERRAAENGEDYEPLIPVMKADDSVIIEIDFHLAKRVKLQQGQNLQNGQNPQGSDIGQGVTGGTTLDSADATAMPLPGPGQQSATGTSNGQDRVAPPRVELTDQERHDHEKLINLIRSRNPYQLSHDGILYMPGFVGIPLLGLTEEQATLRLQVEPAFQKLEVRITRLPLKKYGAEALKPFGYERRRALPRSQTFRYPPITSWGRAMSWVSSSTAPRTAH